LNQPLYFLPSMQSSLICERLTITVITYCYQLLHRKSHQSMQVGRTKILIYIMCLSIYDLCSEVMAAEHND